MGKIIINTPLNIDKEYTVTSSAVTQEVLSLVSTPSQKENKRISLSGIWKDRFREKTGQELQREWRKTLWERS